MHMQAREDVFVQPPALKIQAETGHDRYFPEPEPAQRSISGPVRSTLRRVGRPTKLNSETKTTLLDCIGAGIPFSTSCSIAGLSYETFRRWMVKGRTAKRGQFRGFRVEVRRAEAQAKFRLLVSWMSATRHDWRAARAFLET